MTRKRKSSVAKAKEQKERMRERRELQKQVKKDQEKCKIDKELKQSKGKVKQSVDFKQINTEMKEKVEAGKVEDKVKQNFENDGGHFGEDTKLRNKEVVLKKVEKDQIDQKECKETKLTKDKNYCEINDYNENNYEKNNDENNFEKNNDENNYEKNNDENNFEKNNDENNYEKNNDENNFEKNNDENNYEKNNDENNFEKNNDENNYEKNNDENNFEKNNDENNFEKNNDENNFEKNNDENNFEKNNDENNYEKNNDENNFEKNNDENNFEKNNDENNFDENNFDKNNFDENNFDENNFDKNNFDENNFDKNNFKENNNDENDCEENKYDKNCEKNDYEDNNYDKNNCEKNNNQKYHDKDYDERNYHEINNAETTDSHVDKEREGYGTQRLTNSYQLDPCLSNYLQSNKSPVNISEELQAEMNNSKASTSQSLAKYQNIVDNLMKITMVENQTKHTRLGKRPNRQIFKVEKLQEKKIKHSDDLIHESSNKITSLYSYRSTLVQGSYHQGHSMFGPNAGKQCVGNCLSAVIQSKIKDLHEWNQSDLDSVLVKGNEIYSLVHGNNRYLCVEDLPEYIEIDNRVIHCNKKQSITALIGRVPKEFCGAALSLEQALQSALVDSDGFFVTTREFTSLIIKQNQKLYLFDSHARNRHGYLDINGTSLLLEFTDINTVYRYFCHFVQNDQTIPFDITGVTVVIENADSQINNVSTIDMLQNNRENQTLTENILGVKDDALNEELSESISNQQNKVENQMEIPIFEKPKNYTKLEKRPKRQTSLPEAMKLKEKKMKHSNDLIDQIKHEITTLDKSISILVQGSYHQGHFMFGTNAGKQCVGNCLSAIVQSKLKAVHEWNQSDLDAVLVKGDEIYTLVHGNNQYLCVEDLPEYIEIDNRVIHCNKKQSITALIGQVSKEFCGAALSLEQALQSALVDSDGFFVTTREFTSLIIKQNQKLYLFDSHARNRHGYLDINGTSLLLEFTDINAVYHYFCHFVQNDQTKPFDITGVTVVIDNADRQIKNVSIVDMLQNNRENQRENSLGKDDAAIDTRNNEIDKESSFEVISGCSINTEINLGENKTFANSEANISCRSNKASISINSEKSSSMDFIMDLELKSPDHCPSDNLIRESDVEMVFDDRTTLSFKPLDYFLKRRICTQLKISSNDVRSTVSSSDDSYLGKPFETQPITADGNCLFRALSFAITQRQRHFKRLRHLIVDHCLNIADHLKSFLESPYTTIEEHISGRKMRENNTWGTAIEILAAADLLKTDIYTFYNGVWIKYSSQQIFPGREINDRAIYLKHISNLQHYEVVLSVLEPPFETAENVTMKKKHEEIELNIAKRTKSEKDKLNYKTDPQFRFKKNWKRNITYKQDTEYREKQKLSSRTKYQSDNTYKQLKQKESKQKYSTDKDHQDKVKIASKQKYSNDKDHQDKVKIASKKKYSTDEEHKSKIKSQTLERRKNAIEGKKDIIKVIENFRNCVGKGPEFVCACCFRLFFEKQVLPCRRESYSTNCAKEISVQCISEKYLHRCSDECKDECVYHGSSRRSLWICYTCHRKIMNGKVPAESFSNNLELEDVPDELAKLNKLEQHLVSLNIPFMKVVALPKGGQKAVHGPCVCVPSDISKITKALPRSEDENCLVKVKLKRKLQYKGYEEYQFVDTKHLEVALNYLIKNNDWFSDVQINEKWINPIPLSENESVVEENENVELLDVEMQKKNDAKEQENELTSYLDSSLQGVQFDTCLQPADIGQEALDTLFDKEFDLSPAEGNTPLSLLKEKGLEAKTFPVHYPRGKNTLNDEREDKLSLLRYFNLRLSSVENRFARDTSYIFFCQYMSELDRVMANVQISLRKGSMFSDGKRVTKEMLCDKNSLTGLFRKDEAIKYMKPVRGTPPYWQATQKDIFAMIRQLGIPTFFCSFSSADFRWKEMVTTIMKQQADNRKVEDLSWDEKCKVLSSNPVTTAKMFDHRFHTFLKNVIMSPAEPIGRVKDYFYRVEFQQRGSPHTHCLFWIEGAPKFEEDDDKSVAEFINKYITCRLPSEKEDPELAGIVCTVQQHSKNHSKSCKKKGTACRFNFPRPISKKTFISRPWKEDDDDGERAKRKLNDKKVLESLWEVIRNSEETNLTPDELFQQAGISQEDFQACFKSVTKRNTVVLKREKEEMFINQYNQDLLRAWDANMDIQYVLDAYSCVVYIISYISKSERELGLLLQQTRNEASDGNLDAQQTMKKIGTSYFHFREISAQEAVFRVTGLNLKECSRKVEFIPLGDNPCRMSIPLKNLQFKKSKRSTIKPSGGDDADDDEDIWMTSNYDRYKNRPELQLFNEMCLASFCSEFSTLSESQIPNKINKETTFRLQNDMGYIRKRTRTSDAIIRYPRFSVETSSEQYYQSMLQLFLAHRSFEQLKPPQFPTYEDFYQYGFIRYSQKDETVAVKILVDNNMTKFVKLDKELEVAEQLLEKEGSFDDAWAQLCPETENERHQCIDDGKTSTVQETDDPAVEIPDLNEKDKEENVKASLVKIGFARLEIIPLFRSLNKKQKRIFYKVREWCNLTLNGQNPPAFHVFITGGAGSGKSHLIKCLYYEATRILNQCSPNPDDLTVLLTAPTGTAAFNINGLTIHSALSIFKSLALEKAMLGEDKLNTLRSKLENLQILIIDEISMVNKRLLFFIHKRLCQIKKMSEKCLFGGVSIIAVGDFYQLPPVRAYRTDILYIDDPSNPLNNLWNGLFRIVELDEIMRQKDDMRFAQMLNRIRMKEKKKSLESSDFEILQQCIRDGPDEALHIFATNDEIRTFNNEMIMKLPNEPKLVEAEDFEKDKTTGRREKRKGHFVQKDMCLPTTILLAEGARVMLIKNESVDDGLVNGVMGNVVRISEFSKGSLPNVVYIAFDNERVGKNARIQKVIDGKRCVGLEPSTEDVPFKNGMRKQFALQLAWACTIHKVQGLTVTQVVVDLNKCFAKGQAYVALSRVTSQDGLHIMPIEAEKLNRKIYCDPDIIKGIASMDSYLSENILNHEKQENTVILLCHNIQGLRAHQTDLKCNMDFKDADYICLTETWLETIDEKVDYPGYELHHLPRFAAYESTHPYYFALKNMIRGGVGVYVKSALEYEDVKYKGRNLECISFLIPSIGVLVVTVYRTQKYHLPTFLNNFSSFLDDVEKKYDRIVVVGDFNENIIKGEKTMLEFMSLRGFKQAVEDVTTEGFTLIDHVYITGNIETERIIVHRYRVSALFHTLV